MKDIYWVTESTDMTGAPTLHITEEQITDKSIEFVHINKYAEAISKYSDAASKYASLVDRYILVRDELDKIKLKGILQ